MKNIKSYNEQMQLISVCLELSDNCKVGCPYCLLEDKRKEVSKEKIIDIINVLIEFGVSRFTIGGGEPLDVPYVYEVGNYIKNKNKKVLLRTSACNYMDCERIKTSFDIVDISIDSCSKEIMSICKPNINSEIVFNNIKEFSKKSICYRCNILVTAYNYNNVISTIEWLSKKGVKTIRIQKLVPRGRAKNIYYDIAVSDDKYDKLLKDVFCKCEELNLHIEEVKSVNSKTLCIVKPNGEIFIGTPEGIIEMGEVFNIQDLRDVSSVIYDNQKLIYGVN